MTTKVLRAASILLAVVTTRASAQRTPSRTSPTAQPLVELVGTARWWIEPLEQDQASDGHLYFEAIVRNRSSRELTIGVSFRAYLADGTPYVGCSAPGGQGPGATANVRPGEKAALFCTRTISPLSLKGLRVTSRIEESTPTSAVGVPAVTPSDVAFGNARADLYGRSAFSASALLHVSGARDVGTYVLFRFYDGDGVQLSTCESDGILVQPEVAAKARCNGPVILPDSVARPTKVTAETRTPR